MLSSTKPLFLTSLILFVLTACGGSSTSESGDGGNGATPTPTSTPTSTTEPNPTPTVSPGVPSPSPSASPEPSPFPTPAEFLPDTLPDPELPKPGDHDYTEATEAARFLMQASFGPTAKSIYNLMQKSYEDWIDEQMNMEPRYHLPRLEQRYSDIGYTPAPENEVDEEAWVRDLQRSDIWWESAIWGHDQLRERMAYSLSQIFVISNVSDVLFNDSRGIANYHDILLKHAFGNYRDLLEDITLSPMMGEYLSMIRNEKADPARNIRPDENYAREVMQLFSIGLVELNLDGTIKLDGEGQPIPTYGQDDIKALARVFTGWYHSTITNWWQWVTGGDSEILPMQAFASKHDTDEKIIFGNQVIPANQNAYEDLSDALDILFNHPNVAPFISKQLIQRLVTSNPSNAYVERVASVFNDNGNGARGDLGAVIKAILLDDEARNGHEQMPAIFGKVKEPMLKLTAYWRAFKAQGTRVEETTGIVGQHRLRYRGSDRTFGQRPYGSFSVFNFYRPDYQPSGAIQEAGLYAPELQIHTESQIIASINSLGGSIYWRDTQNEWPATEVAGASWDTYPSAMYFEYEKELAINPQDLLDRINLLLMAGQMSSDMYSEVLSYLNAQETRYPYQIEMMVYDALYLVTASPEFAIQR